MITWKNMDTLAAYADLCAAEKVDLVTAMSGESGAARVKGYSIPMGPGRSGEVRCRASAR